MMEARLVKFQRKQRLYRTFCMETLWYLEAGTEESAVIKRSALLKKPLRHWDDGCWLAGKEKFTVIKKRPVLLSPSDSICCFKLKTPSVTRANIFYLNIREI